MQTNKSQIRILVCVCVSVRGVRGRCVSGLNRIKSRNKLENDELQL